MTNKNSLELKLCSDYFDIKAGCILEVLGQYCPLLQMCNFSYDNIISDVADTQIEFFTKGCQYLKSLCLDFGTLRETPTVTIRLDSTSYYFISVPITLYSKNYNYVVLTTILSFAQLNLLKLSLLVVN